MQALTGSGLSYAILRTGKPDLDAEGSELGQLALGPQGSRPQQAAISPDQACGPLVPHGLVLGTGRACV